MAASPPYRKVAPERAETTASSFHQRVARFRLEGSRQRSNGTNTRAVSQALNAVIEHDRAGMPKDAEKREKRNIDVPDVTHSVEREIFYRITGDASPTTRSAAAGAGGVRQAEARLHSVRVPTARCGTGFSLS
jgi:hypothetical protein